MESLAKNLDIVISFDTTGSMSSVIGSVRKKVTELMKDLHKVDKSIRVGIIAHGDYCDTDEYVIKSHDLTHDAKELEGFIRECTNTFGGDSDELYELVLNTARTKFDWKAGNKKILVLIGDANPHEPGYTCEEMKGKRVELNWRNEAKLLNEMGVDIFAVHALAEIRNSSYKFYKTISEGGDGCYLTLDNLSDIYELILASVYSQYEEVVLDEFVTMIKKTGKLNRGMASNLTRLNKKGKKYDSEEVSELKEAGLRAVPAGRFQVVEVTEDTPIKEFCEENDFEFKIGRGFYQLSKKTVKVQRYKEIILRDKKSGDLFTGPAVRNFLGLKPQTTGTGTGEETMKLDSKLIKLDFDIFIQSTSANRKLLEGTEFLYEINDC